MAVESDPLVDLPDHACLLKHNLILGHAITFLLAEVTISVGGVTQDAHPPRVRGVLLTAAGSLEDLGPLILGQDRLDLEQEPALGALI